MIALLGCQPSKSCDVGGADTWRGDKLGSNIHFEALSESVLAHGAGCVRDLKRSTINERNVLVAVGYSTA